MRLDVKAHYSCEPIRAGVTGLTRFGVYSYRKIYNVKTLENTRQRKIIMLNNQNQIN
jgi:hypothetical protein